MRDKILSLREHAYDKLAKARFYTDRAMNAPQPMSDKRKQQCQEDLFEAQELRKQAEALHNKADSLAWERIGKSPEESGL